MKALVERPFNDADMKILVTGAAGFIGYHLSLRLLSQGFEVVGLDNINDYYDPNLKRDRLRNLGVLSENMLENDIVTSTTEPQFRFARIDLLNKGAIDDLFSRENFDRVCHLAAQAGVRYSLENPYTYIHTNVLGFLNILEACRHNQVGHLAYASSSSVYGLNKNMPFRTDKGTDHPVSLYAASKKSNELMAHTYSHLFGIPTTGLRFFTVYGPWGRPDMALFLFTKAILSGKPIDVYNYGNMLRDFTYIDDIVEGVYRVIQNVPKGNQDWDPANPVPDSSSAPYRIYNIGNNGPVKLMDFIEAIEKSTGHKAIMNMMPIQPGDVPATFADCSGLEKDLDYRPGTPVEKGIENFVKWYREYYQGKS